ncbi:Serine protein kinase PrkA [Candidatus Magnetomoraceae bacterium gMMP-15]
MKNIEKAMQRLNQNMSEQDNRSSIITFEEYLKILVKKPQTVIRNVFQVFYDMMKTYVGEGVDEYPGDPDSINFVYYDYSKLFVEGSDHPFFADRLFANRLMGHVEALKRGAQQNKIYIFEGPPGCGKSTFLNNLLMKFEEYANTEEGSRFDTVWRLDKKLLGPSLDREAIPFLNRESLRPLTEHTPEQITKLLDSSEKIQNEFYSQNFIDIPCPCHDNPILMIPKEHRREFLDDLFKNNEFKWKLFTDKEYDWVFRDNACTICCSVYDGLLNKLGSPLEVFKMLYARPYQFKRRLGKGISVFNPGDKPIKKIVVSNKTLQEEIDKFFKDSNLVKYISSRYAKTNNGIYALMDIKSHNKERLIELHNIISEGVHKVEDIEENVNSLFMALMNPEDKEKIKDIQSFADRIQYINIPYVLDLNTEIKIYRNIFGKHIDDSFIPRVLHNFARVIISTRLKIKSEALLEWIKDPKKYSQYCDENLQLLKMEIYTGHIPTWLSEEDRKTFTAKIRRKIIAESETEGGDGFSGRDSIKIFNEFYSVYAKDDKLINMSTLCNFFTKSRKELGEKIPKGFLDSIIHMYNYTILQEVKESLYYYNEQQISRDIQNYLFAVNFEPVVTETCTFTGENLEITEKFFKDIEDRLLGLTTDKNKRLAFRKDTQKEYTSQALPQEILIEEKDITETSLYESLYERYVYNLKEKVLDPFLENENFRRAIKDYDTEDFKTYDKRIRDDVTFLINNLCDKHKYTEQGAKEVCIYVIDNDLAKSFKNP